MEDPLAPSEEEVIDPAADNANFGPQDVPIIQPDADKVGPTGNVVYNVIVDMPHVVPAAINEVEGSATYSNDAYNTEQEWDVGINNFEPNTTIAELRDEPANVPTGVPTQAPAVRTRSSRQIQPRDIYSPSMFTAAKTKQ